MIPRALVIVSAASTLGVPVFDIDAEPVSRIEGRQGMRNSSKRSFQKVRLRHYTEIQIFFALA
jgi:hypothetical protein